MDIKQTLLIKESVDKILGYDTKELHYAVQKISEEYDIESTDVINYIKKFRIVEDVPTTSTAGVAVADKPLMNKPLKRKEFDEEFSSTDVIFDVDSDMYKKCELGKKKYAKWNKYIDETSELGMGIRHAAKSKNVILRNKDTSAMIHLTKWKK